MRPSNLWQSRHWAPMKGRVGSRDIFGAQPPPMGSTSAFVVQVSKEVCLLELRPPNSLLGRRAGLWLSRQAASQPRQQFRICGGSSCLRGVREICKNQGSEEVRGRDTVFSLASVLDGMLDAESRMTARRIRLAPLSRASTP